MAPATGGPWIPSFFEIHALWAREVTVGFGRLAGEVVGVVGNNSMFKGGVLFVDSAVAGMLTLLEPVRIAFLGVVVGGIVIAMYLPIFDLISKLT